MRKVVIILCATTSLLLLSTTTHADNFIGAVGASASIGFIDSGGGGGSCPSGVTINEQVPLDFGSFAATSNGIMTVDPDTGVNSILSGNPEPTGLSAPVRGSFLVQQAAPEDSCDVFVFSTSEGDPYSCNSGEPMTGEANPAVSIPFRVILIPASGNTQVDSVNGSIWYAGGAIQTSCSANAGAFPADDYGGSYIVNMDNM